MRTLTPNEANATIADMKGWVLMDCGLYYEILSNGFLGECMGAPEKYTPYTKADQASAALEEWVNEDLGRVADLTLSFAGHQVVLFSPKNLKSSANVLNKDLSKAITTALCSAYLGEQVEIKEG